MAAQLVAGSYAIGGLGEAVSLLVHAGGGKELDKDGSRGQDLRWECNALTAFLACGFCRCLWLREDMTGQKRFGGSYCEGCGETAFVQLLEIDSSDRGEDRLKKVPFLSHLKEAPRKFWQLVASQLLTWLLSVVAPGGTCGGGPRWVTLPMMVGVDWHFYTGEFEKGDGTGEQLGNCYHHERMGVGDWDLAVAVEPAGYLIASTCTVCSRPCVGDASVPVVAETKHQGRRGSVFCPAPHNP